MRQAKIKCPHCGSSITVRQADGNDLEPERVSMIWKASDEMWQAMDRMFDAAFGPLIRKK